MCALRRTVQSRHIQAARRRYPLGTVPLKTRFTGDEHFLREALKEAGEAVTAGEVPVGAVVVVAGEIVGRGHNARETRQDPLAHAEVEAIRDAAEHLNSWRIGGSPGGIRRIPTKRIFPLDYRLVKHLRPPPPPWASVFCGRHSTRALSGTTARQEAPGTAPGVLPVGGAGEQAASLSADTDLTSCQAST